MPKRIDSAGPKVQTAEERFKRLALNPYQRDLKRVAAGSDHWAMCTGGLEATWADWIVAVWKRGMRGMHAGLYSRMALEKALEYPRGEPVFALVVHNRWIARCECSGAEVVGVGMPFYCLSCFNLMNDGYSRTVTFPSRVPEIELRLTARTDPLTRNWLPTESESQLEAENAVLGVDHRRRGGE